MPSLNLPTRYARRRLPQTSLLVVPPAELTEDSSVEINLLSSSSTISGRTMNINSYLRFISYLPILSESRGSLISRVVTGLRSVPAEQSPAPADTIATLPRFHSYD